MKAAIEGPSTVVWFVALGAVVDVDVDVVELVERAVVDVVVVEVAT